MTVSVLDAEGLRRLAGCRVDGAFIVTGATFDLDLGSAHDVVADYMVSAAYVQRRSVVWFADGVGGAARKQRRAARVNRQSVVQLVGGSGGVHKQRLRAACGRAGGVAGATAAWRAVVARVRVRDVSDVLIEAQLNQIGRWDRSSVVVIEGMVLDSAAERRAAIGVIESLGSAGTVLVIDGRSEFAGAAGPS